ncbi:MAG: hypothetical protein PHG79_04485 [Methanosarcina sp.]|nr:hypothetical protein [Methanosarcina sp.]MDD3873123.1 hypothetical protein [Methanosarcina sp.]MDD4522274.1 hypothetical protein [Methanosarcina sp.]
MKKLKNGLLGTSILLLFFLAFSQGCTAVADVPPALPMLPMQVTGVALIDGTPASNGTVVAAYLNEKEFLANTSSGNYYLLISGASEDEGKTVTFKVDGKNATSSVAWESGSIVTLELPDGKVVYIENAESNSYSDLNSNSNGNSNGNSNSNSNSNTKSNSNLKTGPNLSTGDKEQGVSSEGSKAEVIKTSIPEPSLTASKNSSENSEDKKAAESSENSPKPESAPGFLIVYAVAGILLLAFGSDFGRGSKKNP